MVLSYRNTNFVGLKIFVLNVRYNFQMINYYTMKRTILIFFYTFFFQLLYSQKEYEIVKIDSTLKPAYFIYIKDNSSLKKNKIFRIGTIQRDSVIVGMMKIKVGDLLKINLEKRPRELKIKQSHVPKDNEKSFFYEDYFEGEKVNINYYSYDFNGLYYLRK